MSNHHCSHCNKPVASPPASPSEGIILTGAALAQLTAQIHSFAFQCRSCQRISCGECAGSAATKHMAPEKLCLSCGSLVDPYRFTDPSASRLDDAVALVEGLVDLPERDRTHVSAGLQVWARSDLSVTHFRNGDPVIQAKDRQVVINGQRVTRATMPRPGEPAFYRSAFGTLYNWHAVNDPRGLAQNGWHIPSLQEWLQLVDYCGGPAVAGRRLKALGRFAGTDEIGFCAMGGGFVNSDGFHDGWGFGSHTAKYWTTTERATPPTSGGDNWVHAITLREQDDAASYEYSEYPKSWLLSVRCVRD